MYFFYLLTVINFWKKKEERQFSPQNENRPSYANPQRLWVACPKNHNVFSRGYGAMSAVFTPQRRCRKPPINTQQTKAPQRYRGKSLSWQLSLLLQSVPGYHYVKSIFVPSFLHITKLRFQSLFLLKSNYYRSSSSENNNNENRYDDTNEKLMNTSSVNTKPTSSLSKKCRPAKEMKLSCILKIATKISTSRSSLLARLHRNRTKILSLARMTL